MDVEQKRSNYSIEALEKWTEMKTNEEVLDFVKEKRTLLSNLRLRRWHMIGHMLRHNEELHSIILKGMVEGKRGRGKPRPCYMSNNQRCKSLFVQATIKDKAQD
ncbi:Hypothetical protein CINCED_3A009791 [Cinara cedri]|uniref:Uncharacterized protein n=1 Tax=Cinara cedri TaxID=506608 RepID=A0A5E4NC64_9HEMI|nr:Hypothetical protein CINCED_3A009791 [Cinara cedri]